MCRNKEKMLFKQFFHTFLQFGQKYFQFFYIPSERLSEAKGYINIAFFSCTYVRTSVRTSVTKIAKMKTDTRRTNKRHRTDRGEANDTAYTSQPYIKHTPTPTQCRSSVRPSTPPHPHSIRLVSVRCPSEHTPTLTQCPSSVRPNTPPHPHSVRPSGVRPSGVK